MSFNQKCAKAFLSSAITFNTKVAGTSSPATALPVGGSPSVSVGTLCAIVTTALTTNTIVVTASWQVSNDGGSTWLTIFPTTGAAYTNMTAAGTGGLVTSTSVLPFPTTGGPAFPLVRINLVNTVATGAAGDTAIVSYQFLKTDFN